jgi:hypothetical protein
MKHSTEEMEAIVAAKKKIRTGASDIGLLIDTLITKGVINKSDLKGTLKDKAKLSLKRSFLH